MKKKVLLYSGGVDSWLIDKLWKPDVKIYINVHGAYSKEEISRLPKDVKVIDFPLGEFEDKETKYIPMRNLYFLMLASNYGDEICYGATAGDYGSADKRPKFIRMAERVINKLIGEQSVSNGRKITIEKRFVKMSKFDIVKEYLDKGGKIEDIYKETFSCFNPQDGEPCLSCKPCFRRFMLLYYFGYKFTKEEKSKMVEYIKNNVLNKKDYTKNKKGTYYKDRKGEGKYLEIAVDKLFKEFDLEVKDYE